MGNIKTNTIVTVCLTGDIDFFEIETVEDCLDPLFKVLQKYQVKMTLPITAKAVEDHPERAEYVLNQGHEVAVHGDVHEPFYGTMEEQFARLDKAKQIFKDILGFVPPGFRAPRMGHDSNTYLALIKAGFLYDSSQARNEVLLRLPFNKKFFYDLGVFPTVKPFLRLYASAKFRRTPATPFFLHNQLIELPVTGPPDSFFISSKRGPRYSPNQAHRIAEIWLDIVRDMEQRENQLFVVQAHPAIVSPSHVEAIDLFLKVISEDARVEIKLLGDVAKSFVDTQQKEHISQLV